MMEPSLILQAAEQLERTSSTGSLSGILSGTTPTITTQTNPPSFEKPLLATDCSNSQNGDYDQQRLYDVAQIMARIGYNGDNIVKKEPQSPTSSYHQPPLLASYHQQHLTPTSNQLSSSPTYIPASSILSSAPSSTSSSSSYYPSTTIPTHPFLPIPTMVSPSSTPFPNNSFPQSSSSLQQQQQQQQQQNLIMLTKRKKEVYMTKHDWDDACVVAVECLKLNTKTEITLSHFALELETRCTVKNNGIKLFMIFPWFHMKNIRFRQSLKRDGRLGPTIEKVIECVNYFLRKNGKDYSEDELQFLLNYYKRMDIPEPSRCLTTIVEVYTEFRKFQDEIYRSNTQGEVIKLLIDQGRMIEELTRSVESLRQEIAELRENGTSDSQVSKKPRI